MEQAGGARQHSVLGKTFHWGFIILYAYGIFKQIDELEELEDPAELDEDLNMFRFTPEWVMIPPFSSAPLEVREDRAA